VYVCRSLLFARKGKTDLINDKGISDVLGWKLFGKIPPKRAPEKDASDMSLGCDQSRTLDTGKLEPKMMTNSALVRGQVARRSDREVPSTTALILEHRPELVRYCYGVCFVYCTYCCSVVQIQHDVKYRYLKCVVMTSHR